MSRIMKIDKDGILNFSFKNVLAFELQDRLSYNDVSVASSQKAASAQQLNRNFNPCKHAWPTQIFQYQGYCVLV